MPKAEHSPGPWHLIGSRNLGFTVHASLPDDAGDTDVLAVCRNISRDTNEANAILIGAAPCLLAALRAIMSEADGGWLRESPIARQALAAITKATRGD